MSPLAKPAPAGTASTQRLTTIFRIFEDERGRWCARSDDGMTGEALLGAQRVSRASILRL